MCPPVRRGCRWPARRRCRRRSGGGRASRRGPARRGPLRPASAPRPCSARRPSPRPRWWCSCAAGRVGRREAAAVTSARCGRRGAGIGREQVGQAVQHAGAGVEQRSGRVDDDEGGHGGAILQHLAGRADATGDTAGDRSRSCTHVALHHPRRPARSRRRGRRGPTEPGVGPVVERSAPAEVEQDRRRDDGYDLTGVGPDRVPDVVLLQPAPSHRRPRPTRTRCRRTGRPRGHGARGSEDRARPSPGSPAHHRGHRPRRPCPAARAPPSCRSATPDRCGGDAPPEPRRRRSGRCAARC